MNGMYESEYKGVKIRITYGTDKHGAVEGWRVFLDDEELNAVTTEAGASLLGFAHDYTNPEAADKGSDPDFFDALRDPAQIQPGGTDWPFGTVRLCPVSEGRGRTLYVGTDGWNLESIPVQLIKPYIDHMLLLRETYASTAFQQFLASELGSPEE